MKKSISQLAFLPLFCLLATLAAAGEGEPAQPYEKIRYPTFKDGRLQSLLEADQAEAYDLSEGTPRINLKNVLITHYDDSEEARRTIPEDQPLKVKMTITADRGFFLRRPPEPNGVPEEIANLEGNVVVRQMRTKLEPQPPQLRPKRLPPDVEAEIRCQHAQWNNSLRKLNGDGEVEFLQEDSRIVGTGFLYLPDDEAMEMGGGTSKIKDWGGIAFIEHDARMEIDRPTADGVVRTEITCSDTASYKLREREIQFEKDVKVSRPGLLIESDILKVFLHQEDELLPESVRMGDTVLPGQVKSIVATIGRRPGSVVITGSDIGSGGAEVRQYTAKGGRADYDFVANRITLTDSREGRAPEVEFDQGRISDRNLDFVLTRPQQAKSADTPVTLETLNASGGEGQVSLRPVRPGGPLVAATEVSYKQDMNYDRSEGRIRFRGSVYLRRSDLRMRAEILDVRLTVDPRAVDPGQVDRIVAETDVEIQAGNREAKAHRAEYDVDTKSALDTLRLFGPPQRTPPNPEVTDEFGNKITAPEILMQRQAKNAANPFDRDRHLVRAGAGTAVCDFFVTPDNLTERGRNVSIKCEDGMEYDESTQVAQFNGKVVVTSDNPEDNYVLTSDRLIINFYETPDPDNPSDPTVWVRRIDANGSARLEQDIRICEANRIIRDFPTPDPKEGDIYLEGAASQGGRPPIMAVYREQTATGLGSLFAAPRIKSSPNGDSIQANGPGQLSVPDPDAPRSADPNAPPPRSEIHFEGGASYKSQAGGMVSDAQFWRGVHLSQPSRKLTINAEELDARFLRDPTARELEAEDAVTIRRIGNLRRAEARGGVKLETESEDKAGKRVAIGDRGVVEFADTGNIVRLEADRRQDKRRFVMTRDHDGLMLRAPDLEIREAQGIMRASGPGELQIPGDRSGEGLSRVPTRVIYGERGALVYNELALNIRANDNVWVVQPGVGNNWSSPSLDGRCDQLDITLLEPPSQGMSGDDALSRVARMDAQGAVLLRVYAEPPPDQPNIDWLNRPGTTFFTRGDIATYDVPRGEIKITSLPGRQPQLLLNMVDVGSPPRRQRLKADSFTLNTNTTPRRWTFDGQLESNTLREGEPFEFQN